MTLDGNDIFTTYGVCVVNGGLNGLLSFPALKTPASNDWQEYDGLEVDLENPVLNTRDIQLSFSASSENGYNAFLAALGGSTAYHTIVVLGRSFTLRYVQQQSLTQGESLFNFALRFADDFPMKRSTHTYVAPNGSVLIDSGYTLGGLGSPASRLLSAYGVSVLSGSYTELMKNPAAKQNLLRNILSQSGAIYDNSQVRYKSRDVKLTCLMRAAGATQLWRNYDALLYDLIRPNARTLNGHSCYYKQMAVSEFYPDGKPWMKFTLTLCFI